MPYIYTLFAQSETGAAPPLRPLWFDYPHDTAAALIADEYLVGGDLLVAPVVEQNRRSRKVYLPKGDAWIDWWSGARHDGGKWIVVDAPLDRLPLLVRAGASVPTQPVIQHTGEMKNAPLTIAVATGAAGTSEIYQDAGDGYAYRKGASRTIKVTVSGGKVTLDIPKSNAYQRVGAVEFLGVDAAPSVVTIDGKSVTDAAYDPVTKRLLVSLSSESIKEVVFVR